MYGFIAASAAGVLATLFTAGAIDALILSVICSSIALITLRRTSPWPKTEQVACRFGVINGNEGTPKQLRFLPLSRRAS